MKLGTLFFCLALLATCVLAWTKEDHEIFDLVSAVEAAEGKGTTFYSWLDIPSSASTTTISKAYRKKSVLLHPDKNPGVKGIQERFARLGVVAAILRNSESRKRYDFFYRNGVPKWRGTGYYYARFRPGVGTVLVFLALLTSSLQFMVQKMNYNRDLKRVESIIREAKRAAWGNSPVPGVGQKKVRVNLGGSARMDEEGNVIPGKMIDMLVDGDDVFIVEGPEDLIKVDASTAIQPSIGNTWVVNIARGLLRKVINGRQDGNPIEESDSDDTSISETSASGYDSQSAKGRRAATKAGGMRRKAIRNRNR